jgi:hypothetical protein
MSLRYTDDKELQKKGEVDSMAWQTYAAENLVVLGNAIQDMVQQKDKLPNQLWELASVISKTLSGIKVTIPQFLLVCSYKNYSL